MSGDVVLTIEIFKEGEIFVVTKEENSQEWILD